MTRSQTAAADGAALLRARNPLLWIVTREEARAERHLIEACAAANYIPKFWDCAAGITNADGRGTNTGQDPGEALATIQSNAKTGTDRAAWIMRDLAPWLAGPGAMPTVRALRNFCRSPGAGMNAQSVIVLTPSSDIPPELAGHATVIEWPMPDREEIAAMLDMAISNAVARTANTERPLTIEDIAPNGQRDAAVDAAIGLSGEEAESCYARSLVQLRRIDPAMVAKEKKRVIARERVLEWFDPLPGGLNAVGGLDNLKSWLIARKAAYSPKARAYGLPAPKGALLVGVPGCGKSLTAKALATGYGVPLLRLDLGALKSKFVGESEGNLRRAFRVIESVGRCVVWLDEVEKALAGATQGAADGGVSSDALGSILSWMQERQGEAFVIATANDVSSLPPELLRKGRFDEVWFIDLPNHTERMAVTLASLTAHNRFKLPIVYSQVADATEGFTGAEIAALVPDALFAAYADAAREITTQDLIDAARTVVPLSKTAAEKIKTLRDWAVGRARYATSAEQTREEVRPLRVLDL
jgi:hypothetical protein